MADLPPIVRKLEALAQAIAALPRIGAEAYAGASHQVRPIVQQHFTAGNHGRYGWAPLSQAYAKRKAGQAGALRKGMRERGATVSKLDPSVPFQSSTGMLMGLGAGKNLPMLVRTGRLRDAVVSRTLHAISVAGDVATVHFRGLPDYAVYLHEGTPKMPKRSPVEIGPADHVQIVDAMRRFLRARLGQGSPDVDATGRVGPMPRLVG